MTARSTLPVGAWAFYVLLFHLAHPAPSQGPLAFGITADSSTAPIFPSIFQEVGVGFQAGTPWQYVGAFTNGPNFIVVSPSSDTSGTSGITLIGLNPNVFPYLRPGTYGLSVAFGQPGQPLRTASACKGGAHG